MRRLLPFLIAVPAAGLLAGCEAAGEASGAFLAANAAAIPVIHRTPIDLVWSTITGRDCSVVRLDRLQSYCRPIEPPPAPPPYCTRTLGTVDCWRDPAKYTGLPPQVADGPPGLTPAQEANRSAPWSPL